MRKFTPFTLVVLLMAMLVSCAQPTAQVIVQTQVVEKEVIKPRLLRRSY